MNPTIEIKCWTCKHYDRYWFICRKNKIKINDEEKQHCYEWTSLKKSVRSAIAKSYHQNRESEVEE